METTEDSTSSLAPNAAEPHLDGIPPLLTMPVEIILRISRHLSTDDLCSFRQTCRGLEQAVLSSFAAEFFTRKQFMMSDFSLNALVDIAKSRFGPRLSELHFGLDRFDPSPLWLASLSEAQVERYEHFYKEQKDLWHSGRINSLLTEAFRHLKGLESVVIRDFDSITRYRDGPAEPWRSYGSLTLLRECGIVSTFDRRSRRRFASSISDAERVTNVPYAGSVFASVLRSLAEAHARPPSVKIYARRGHQLPDCAFKSVDAPPLSYGPVLGGLRKLHLCIQPSPPLKNFDPLNHKLGQFLARAPNLEELRINCDNERADPEVTASLVPFLSWLAAQPPPETSSSLSAASGPLPLANNSPVDQLLSGHGPPTAFSNLHMFSLGALTASPEAILAIITKLSPQLKRLELWRVTLIPHNVTSAAASRTKGCLWISFFRGLLEIPHLELKSLLVGRVRTASRLSHDGWIRFVEDERDWDQDPPVEKKYEGPDWRKFVKGLAMTYHSGWEAQKSGKRALETYINRFGGSIDMRQEIAKRTATLDQLIARTTYHVEPTGAWDEDEYFEDVQSEWIHDEIEHLGSEAEVLSDEE